jgi:GTP-binding protein
MSQARARFLGSFTDALPSPTLPEVAFAGRSNVGKSSAINTLTGVSGLARTAKTPGRTQAINLFAIDESWIAVDLPGYGYAKVGHTLREQWKGFIETYLGSRETLRMVVALVDSRHPPQEADTQLLDGLGAAQIPTLVVATKIDAFSRTRREDALRALAEGHGLPRDAVVGFSSMDLTGKDEVLRRIAMVTGTRGPSGKRPGARGR